MLLDMINSTGADYAHFRCIEAVVEEVFLPTP